MGVLKVIGNFLFGKDPDIFNEKGEVVHKHPKKKWDAWQDRFRTNPDYNWRTHTGTSAGARSAGANKTSQK